MIMSIFFMKTGVRQTNESLSYPNIYYRTLNFSLSMPILGYPLRFLALPDRTNSSPHGSNFRDPSAGLVFTKRPGHGSYECIAFYY